MLAHREHDFTFRFSRLRTFFSTMASAWVTMLFSGPPPISSALLGASMGFAEAQSTGIVTASVSRPAAHYSFGKLTKRAQTDIEVGSAMMNHMRAMFDSFLPQNFKFQSHRGNIVTNSSYVMLQQCWRQDHVPCVRLSEASTGNGSSGFSRQGNMLQYGRLWNTLEAIPE